jgi:hypothetical protein
MLLAPEGTAIYPMWRRHDDDVHDLERDGSFVREIPSKQASQFFLIASALQM